MDYNLLDWLLSFAPMLLVLGLMVGWRWNASRAGLAGWLLAILLAMGRFGAGSRAIGYAQIKALILTADVLLVIWAALLLYYVVERAGALAVIADTLSGLTSDRLIQVLLLGWVFTSFLQGLGGFGVPVAIVAPLLVGMGIPLVKAVLIPSVGHGWAVTFGSLAASFVMLINTTGRPDTELAAAPAIMLGVLGLVSGWMAAHALDGWDAVRRSTPFVLVTGATMALVQYGLAVNGLWSVAAVGGGMAGLVVSVGWIRWQGRASSDARPRAHTGAPLHNPKPAPSIQLALAGYLILVALALFLRGIEPVKEFFNQWALAVDIPATTTSRDWSVARAADVGFGILAHPGTIILYSCLIAFVLYWRGGFYRPDAARDIMQQAGRRATKTGIGVFMMVSIAATMERAGMTQILAEGLADAVPADLYAFVAPLIGALGAFVTGSNTNSNAVFGMLQLNTAEMLGLSVATILGAQTSAAAVASVLSPAKVAVGCSTVDANEGVVLRWLLGYGAILVGLVAVMTWVAVQWG